MRGTDLGRGALLSETGSALPGSSPPLGRSRVAMHGHEDVAGSRSVADDSRHRAGVEPTLQARRLRGGVAALSLLLAACNVGAPVTMPSGRSAATSAATQSPASTTSARPSATTDIAPSQSPIPVPSPTTGVTTTVVADVVYYDVSGDTAEELAEEMERDGPNGFAGFVEWFITWDWDQSDSEPCYVPSGSVTVRTVTTLPDWADRGSASANLGNRWDDFLETLMEHEVGHARNATRTGERIESLLESASSPTCRALSRDLDDEAYEELDDARQWDIQYDRRTRHGATQGAVWEY